MEMGRLNLLQRNVIHEFDHALVRRNLRGCYGQLEGSPVSLMNRFPRTIFFLDRGLKTLLSGTGLGRFLAFRYLAIFDKIPLGAAA